MPAVSGGRRGGGDQQNGMPGRGRGRGGWSHRQGGADEEIAVAGTAGPGTKGRTEYTVVGGKGRGKGGEHGHEGGARKLTKRSVEVEEQ